MPSDPVFFRLFRICGADGKRNLTAAAPGGGGGHRGARSPTVLGRALDGKKRLHDTHGALDIGRLLADRRDIVQRLFGRLRPGEPGDDHGSKILRGEAAARRRSEETKSELQSLMRTSDT